MFSFVGKKDRIFYLPSKAETGLTVTGYFILPDENASKTDEYTFVEKDDGVYYLDYEYLLAGKYCKVVKENGIVTKREVFKVG